MTGDLRTSKIIRPFNLFYPFLWQFRMKQDMIWLIYAEKSSFHPTYKLLLYFASFMLKYLFAVLLTLKHFWYLRARNLYYSIMTLDMFMHLNHNLYTVVSPFTPWYRSLENVCTWSCISGCRRIKLKSWEEAIQLVCGPPWPSKTAKRDHSLRGEGNFKLILFMRLKIFF